MATTTITKAHSSASKSAVQPWFPVETERLRLRELRASDRDEVYGCAADPESVLFVAWTPHDVLEDIQGTLAAWLQEQEKRPRCCAVVAIERIRDKRFVGIISLSMNDEACRSVCLGYVVDGKYRGRGYATEAGKAALNIAFDRIGAKRVFAVCDTGNKASIRVAEKLALGREERLIADRFVHGRWRDSFVYAVQLERFIEPPLPHAV